MAAKARWATAYFASREIFLKLELSAKFWPVCYQISGQQTCKPEFWSDCIYLRSPRGVPFTDKSTPETCAIFSCFTAQQKQFAICST